MVMTNIKEARPVQRSEKKNTLIKVRPSTTPISRNCVKIVPDMTGRMRAQYLQEVSQLYKKISHISHLHLLEYELVIHDTVDQLLVVLLLGHGVIHAQFAYAFLQYIQMGAQYQGIYQGICV